MTSLHDFWVFLTTASNWGGRNGIGARTLAHMLISVVAVLAAGLLTMPAAVWLGHRRRGGVVAIAAVNLGRAIPSLAILALALPLSIRYGFGLGAFPTVVALIVLAMPPLFANTYIGLVTLDPALVDAARGLGYTEFEIIRGVELPLATPLIITGIRVALVQVLATAALGALVAFSGLGSFIVEGFAQFDNGKTLTGAVFTSVLAISAEAALLRTQRRLTPWKVSESVESRPTKRKTAVSGVVQAGPLDT
ncbi:MAG: ABC transporter permease [Microthrixaceae bacterium]